MAIAEKHKAKDAWDTFREMQVSEDRVKKACIQVLKRQLNKMYMEDSHTINEYSMKLTTLVGEIRSLGMKLDENNDLDKMFVSEAIGRLRTFE